MRMLHVLAGLSLMLIGVPAEAQGAAAHSYGDLAVAFGAIGVSIAAFGGALGQGRIIASAVESIARNPGASGSMFLPWILGMVLIESLVIYALVIGAKVVGLF